MDPANYNSIAIVFIELWRHENLLFTSGLINIAHGGEFSTL